MPHWSAPKRNVDVFSINLEECKLQIRNKNEMTSIDNTSKEVLVVEKVINEIFYHLFLHMQYLVQIVPPQHGAVCKRLNIFSDRYESATHFGDLV